MLEVTYGWYWAADVLEAAGAEVNLAHPLGVKAFAYRRVKMSTTLRTWLTCCGWGCRGRGVASEEIRELLDVPRPTPEDQAICAATAPDAVFTVRT